MTEILLVRHGEAHVNINDLAFGNRDSPLTPHGIEQALELGEELKDYEGQAAATSTYVRAQQTATQAGFPYPVRMPILDESDLDPVIFDWSGLNEPMDKHVKERWVPLETLDRASSFLQMIVTGDLDYQVYFTHGLFIAGVLLAAEIAGFDVGRPFDPVRGYVPLRAEIVRLEIPTHDPAD